MKTMTITYHASNNCGSFLQAYALQQTLINMFSVENTIIDFRSRELIQNYSLFRPFRSPKNAFKNLYSLIHYKSLKTRAARFEAARRQYLQLTDTIHDMSDLICKRQAADLYIAGSDQIWNTTAPDFSEAFFLPGFSNKAAYGISLGSDYMKAPLSAYVQSIQEFCSISARETQGAEEISKYYDRSVSVVSDPALLLSEEQYSLFVSDGSPESATDKKNEENYIFYYSMKYTTPGLRQTVALSKETGLPMITVFTNYHTCRVPHGMKVYYDAGPKEFLRLLSRAKIVVTDSYHGTIFSILYHKPFVYPVAEQDRDDRIRNLLGSLQIPIDSVSAEAVLCGRGIDWTSTDRQIELQRSHSLAFIEKMLDACKTVNQEASNVSSHF
ncbi:MAG: polysaccharide pyruvyl transferase family protein [Lachnospiraceae bacterium]|nr:polysaccharide pyruvyl transferase family protein [Lachnospiraceae bacterium]